MSNMKPDQSFNFSQSNLLVTPGTVEEQSLGTSQTDTNAMYTLLEPLNFTNSGSNWPQSSKGTPITISYSYSNLLDGNLPGGLAASTLTSAIEEALRLWATYAPLNFVERPDSGPAPSNDNYPAANHPQIRFGHQSIDGSGGTLAFAFLPLSPTTSGLAGDISFDLGDTWKINPSSPNEIDLLEVAVHEIGHALGLGHEDGNNAIMNPAYGDRYSGLGSAFLLQDDINGIRDIYGMGSGSVRSLSGKIFGTPNNDNIMGTPGADTIYAFAGNDTLIGLGGNDTLDGGDGEDTGDYSSATQGINVTLGASGFATNDGFGTQDTLSGIDHILGSQYNDTIVGDAGWNNRLVGGDGNDNLSGLGGNDTLTGGAGADTFLFNSVSEGIDTVTDFSHSSGDKIFIPSTFGATSTSQFSYNDTTGALSFNSTQFATLNTNSDSIIAEDITFA